MERAGRACASPGSALSRGVGFLLRPQQADEASGGADQDHGQRALRPAAMVLNEAQRAARRLRGARGHRHRQESTVGYAQALARALGITVDELLREDGAG